MKITREANFDGLVGLTHHYAGLSFGNEASTKHQFRVSNPEAGGKTRAAENESAGGRGVSAGA
ncbi:N-succinylarginine dihydrolase [Cedecea neteri]|uniref:N-succinylarginine dihydrolase n=1 Tax=Cedecea neteri TaxID=158822 RepID=A0A2X3L2M9_9ENTR|nr:N-succinylarginine dihydrolase [Cedecea neteri]